MNTESKNLDQGPVDLSQLVDYAPDSVVSRTIVNKKGGTVTLFAFAEGQGLSTHSAPFDALIVVLSGEAEITVGEVAHTVKSHESIFLPAEVPHAVRANRSFKMMLTMIRQ
jgi:quercetin dioxygenase-like cupin family protein